jgi:murein L,D-transpeptidase YcbB/YkuD
LLRIADHLLFGKVDAATFDARWNYTRNPIGIDIPQRIERALASDDIYAEIEKLKPTHPLYLSLKQELARYRQAAADTERVTIAQGKSIEPDTHDERVLALRKRLSASGDLEAAQDSESDPLRRHGAGRDAPVPGTHGTRRRWKARTHASSPS